MALVTSLPEELLSVIFNKLKDLNDLKSLAECRLACKAWSDPAERAMLSTVTITYNAAKMQSLYAVLKKNPEKANLIKHLNFCDTNTFTDDCVIDLLQIAFTSNVECITGFIWEEDFMDALMNIVARSPNKLDKLKTLALVSFVSEAPLEIALHCKNTLQTIHLDFTALYRGIDWTFVDRLNEFINLTSLELSAEIGTINDLDRILSKCSQLQKLSLAITGWESVLDWDQQRTERNTNLKMLSIVQGYCPIQLLEYLLYKYPSIECASVNAKIDASFGGEYVIQVPRLLRRVPHRKLIYGVMENADIRFILRYLINNGCRITVEKPALLSTDIRIKIDY